LLLFKTLKSSSHRWANAIAIAARQLLWTGQATQLSSNLHQCAAAFRCWHCWQQFCCPLVLLLMSPLPLPSLTLQVDCRIIVFIIVLLLAVVVLLPALSFPEALLLGLAAALFCHCLVVPLLGIAVAWHCRHLALLSLGPSSHRFILAHFTIDLACADACCGGSFTSTS